MTEQSERQTRSEYLSIQTTLYSPVRTLEEAKRLLSECKELRLNEQMYKRECRAQTAKIEEELERLRRAQSEEDQLVEELGIFNFCAYQ